MNPVLQATGPERLNSFPEPLQKSLALLQGMVEHLDLSSVVGILVALLLVAGAIKLIRNAIEEARGRTVPGVRDIQGLASEAKRHKRQGNHQEAGRCYEALERYDEAIEMFTKAKSYRSLGVLYERQRNWVKAAIYYEQAQDYEKAGDMALRANNFKMAGEAYLKGRKDYRQPRLLKKGGIIRRRPNSTKRTAILPKPQAVLKKFKNC
jgi:tetratricopeptide (TPR) repeat protein